MIAFPRTPVLVPTDYSEASLQAIHVARSIAVADSDVTVIYVAQDYDLTLHPLTWSGGPMPTYQMDRLLAGLRKWSEEHNLGEISLAVRIGDPGMQVCDFAEEAKSKLIVVPSHGRHGVSRLMLGSVAERIIRHCHCSVLVLRRATEPDESGSLQVDWLPRKWVVVPIDFSEASKSAIDTALEVAQNRDRIDIVSVIPASTDIEIYGVGELPDDVRKANTQEYIKRYLAEHGYGALRSHVLIGDPGTKIIQHAVDVDADLIIMPSHGRHGLKRWLLGSTTERVLRHSEKPVLVLRGDSELRTIHTLHSAALEDFPSQAMATDID